MNYAELQSSFEVVVEEKISFGTLMDIAFKEDHALSAIPAPTLGTIVQYFPYYAEVGSEKLLEVPKARQLTRAGLLVILMKYGFHPRNEG